MPKIGKKEQKILNAIARKKLDSVKDIKDLVKASDSLENIPNWRPALYNTEQELQILIDAYFKEADDKKEHPTITGLALKLWIDRSTLLDYSKKDKFSFPIKEARQKILNYTEKLLLSKDKFTPGQIFYLKNNYKNDYQDKIEIDNKHSWSISLVELSKLANELPEWEILDGELLE